MDNETLVPFKQFSNKEDAEEMFEFLKNKGIVVELSKVEGILDEVIIGTSPGNRFEIKIKEENFKKALDLMDEFSESILNTIDPSYFLFSYTNEELLEVLTKPYEWSELDVVLSKKILKDRKVTIDPKEIEKKQESHLEELAKPEDGQEIWIIVGYICAFVGGFFGLLIGYFIWQAKKNLPDGTKVPAYSETVRKHAFRIFIISAIIFPITILARVYSDIIEFLP